MKRGTVLTAAPMAELVGVSWPVLRDWCETIPGFDGADAFVRGGNGIEWEFKPGATIGVLTKHFTALQAAGAKRTKRMKEIVGGPALAAAPDDYSLDELAKMVKLSATVQDQLERQGKLIDAVKAADAAREFCATVQQAVLRSAQEQDPNGRWAPEVREAFENATRSVLLQVERAGREWLGALGQA